MLLFLQNGMKYINGKSISYILNITPPMYQSNLCERCIDWIQNKSQSNLMNKDSINDDIDLVLQSIMKCQERAKFWEKTQNRNVFAKSPMSHQKSGDQRTLTFGDETEETRETDNNADDTSGAVPSLCL